MQNEIIEVDGAKWLVKEAVSMDAALDAIAMARCTGSRGSKHIEQRNGTEQVMAEVSRAVA